MTSDAVIIIIIPSAGFPPKQLFVNKMHCFIDTELSGALVMSQCDKNRGTRKVSELRTERERERIKIFILSPFYLHLYEHFGNHGI